MIGKVITIMLLLLSFASIGRGQGYLVRQYTETDGLPSSTVHDVTQDGLGRMWFATRAGISCYDGVSWQNFTLADGLPIISFAKIRTDQKGRIWALADSRQYRICVAFYEGSRWHQIETREIPDADLIEMTAFQLMEKSSQVVAAVGTADHGLFLWQGEKWHHLSENNGLSSNSVNGIAALKGKFYIVTDDDLSIVNSDLTVDNRFNRLLDLPPGEIKGIAAEYKGKYPGTILKQSRIWLYSPGWLGYFYEGSDEMTFYPAENLFMERVERIIIAPDYRGGVYLSKPYATYYFNYETNSWQTIGVLNGLIDPGTYSIFIDFEKNAWFTCHRGVSKLSSRRFESYQMKHGLLEDEVTAVLEYEPGKFVLGHVHGVTFYDGKEFVKIPFTQKRQPRVTSSRVLDMKVDSQKNIWAAASSSGLVKISPRRRITWYGKRDGLPDAILSLAIDERDNLWVGAHQGVFARRGVGFVAERFGNIPVPNPRRMIASAGKLRYCDGGANGIYLFKEEENRWINLRVPGDLKANNVYSLKKDSRGRFLIGTLAGLFVLKDETILRFKEKGFKVERPVYFILEDNKNRLWFGTDNGVVRWDGTEERRYSVPEGLIGQETNRAAGIVDSMGRVWIGTNRGVSIYNETFDDQQSTLPPPRVQLLHVEVLDKKIALDRRETIRLGAKENSIEFHFRGISFLDETAIRFKSRLEGFEQGWSAEKYLHNQTIRYTNLPAGRYRFHLKARNGAGIWSGAISSPQIEVQKPIYRRWWFYLSAMLVLGFILYSLFGFLSQKRHARLLAKEVEKRTNQLQAMQQQLIQSQKMEAIGTLAGGIAHDFNNILGVITGYTEMMLEDLPKESSLYGDAVHVLKAAERASGLVNQILTFSRHSDREHKPLRLGIILKEALELLRASLPATIEIRQDIRSQSDLIMADLTQLHQIMMNLATNAAHAMQEAGGVLTVILDEVFLDEEAVKEYSDLSPGPYLRLSFGDTGRGISQDVIDRIFEPYFTTKKTGEGTGMGLAVIHGIVKSHGGDITVQSEPGKGTTFHILLPRLEGDPYAEAQKKAEEIPTGTECILLVDDEKGLAEIGSRILERLGYDVLGSSDSREALKIFSQAPERFDLVISDLTMPHMTGIQLAAEIKKIRPAIPIILCSGFGEAAAAGELARIGVNDFIKKPIIKRDLARIVRKVLDRAH